ncbi:MAG: hypothetical protein EOO40_00275 [Deltaproteobacteria bacterium]|nr:MAG: hypothetical protein EOO40_00275 [Deltaproteobacteria bacterium]
MTNRRRTQTLADMPTYLLPPRRGYIEPWGPVQQASCAAIYRGLTERQTDITHSGLTADRLNLDQAICTIVKTSDSRSLTRMVYRDISDNGYLPGGWSTRWPDRFTNQTPPSPGRPLPAALTPPPPAPPKPSEPKP